MVKYSLFFSDRKDFCYDDLQPIYCNGSNFYNGVYFWYCPREIQGTDLANYWQGTHYGRVTVYPVDEHDLIEKLNQLNLNDNFDNLINEFFRVGLFLQGIFNEEDLIVHLLQPLNQMVRFS